jgi:hypothetical protein
MLLMLLQMDFQMSFAYASLLFPQERIRVQWSGNYNRLTLSGIFLSNNVRVLAWASWEIKSLLDEIVSCLKENLTRVLATSEIMIDPSMGRTLSLNISFKL